MSMTNRTAIGEQALESVQNYAWNYKATIADIETYDFLIGQIEEQRRATGQSLLDAEEWTAHMEHRKLLIEDLDDYTARLQKVQELVEALQVEEKIKYPWRF